VSLAAADVLESRRLMAATLYVNGSEGNDAIRIFDSGGQLSVTVNSNTAPYSLATYDSVVVLAGAGDDAVDVSGTPVTVTLQGGAGNDTLIGGSARDLLYGGDGDDYLKGGSGNDLFDGGANATADGDAVDYRDHTNGLGVTVSIDGNANDGNGEDGPGDNVLNNVEHLIGTEAGDTLHGSDGPEKISGVGGWDELYGHDGNDNLIGGAGDDHMYGQLGNDNLTGEAGFDSHFGGDGDDNMLGGGDADYFDGGPNATFLGDVVNYGDHAQGVVITLDNQSNDGNYDEDRDFFGEGAGDNVLDTVERIWGSNQSDSITGSGGIDWFWGLGGEDTLRGGSHNDHLYGGDGQDWLFGDDGTDTLYGENDNDIIHGGDGDDTLYGGNGRDYLAGEMQRDTIYGEGNSDTIYTAFDGGAIDWVDGGADDRRWVQTGYGYGYGAYGYYVDGDVLDRDAGDQYINCEEVTTH
jgi:hypothetical protein